MADVAIDASAGVSNDVPISGSSAFMGPYFVSQSIGYMFGADSNDDLVYYKTTNGGAAWGAAVAVATNAAEGPTGISTFADWIVPGDTGTKIHISYVDDGNILVRYLSLDTATDTLSAKVTAGTPTGWVGEANSTTHIVKARNGYLYIRYSSNPTQVAGFVRSINNGTNWTARTSPMETDRLDGTMCLPFPATGTGDDADLWMIYGDVSANAITIKTYDDSANSWSESTSLTTATVLSTAGQQQISASVRHSDGHIILAVNTHIDNAAADLLVFDITNGTTWTAKTNIITNIDDWATTATFIDQNTDDIYIGWLGNPTGTDTWATTVNPYYAKSTDGGTTWGSLTLYAEGVADDYRSLWGGVSTKGAADGRFILAWFDDDDNDLWTNAVNSIAMTAAVAGGQPTMMRWGGVPGMTYTGRGRW